MALAACSVEMMLFGNFATVRQIAGSAPCQIWQPVLCPSLHCCFIVPDLLSMEQHRYVGVYQEKGRSVRGCYQHICSCSPGYDRLYIGIWTLEQAPGLAVSSYNHGDLPGQRCATSSSLQREGVDQPGGVDAKGNEASLTGRQSCLMYSRYDIAL